ncbi:F-box only protein 39-like [Physella acuta]|uniref:F-box only protein 39-like n=1 Tax=Physella acuta TaxID=109671 RepID=UPI0027DD9F64|nr:F-box only protein 39-like [Physella acuta]
MSEETNTGRVTVDHVDSEGDVAKRGTKCTDQCLAPLEWSQLPYEILLKVFRYLSNSDKYHAALTCNSWLRPLSEPSLWHSGNFVFNAKSDEKAIKFAKINGKSLRHIQTECSENADETAGTANLYSFLSNLINSRNHQLLTFKLTNLALAQKTVDGEFMRDVSDVTKLLKKLLKGQLQLRELDLRNSQLSVKAGLKVLKAASKNCAKTIQKLTIDRLLVYQVNNHYVGDDFVAAIACFSNLADLELSYDYLCDDLLLRLAQTTRSLKVLTVRAINHPPLESKTYYGAWNKLSKACPELRVIFFIKSINESHFDESTIEILTPFMPLYQLHWDAGRLIAIENIDAFFEHVRLHFQNTIHHLELQTGVRLDTESFEKLFKSLQPCKHLETLSLGLTFDMSGDVEMYNLTIRDVTALYPVSCDVTLNGQIVN